MRKLKICLLLLLMLAALTCSSALAASVTY